MKETAPTEAVGCMIEGAQEAKTEILVQICLPLTPAGFFPTLWGMRYVFMALGLLATCTFLSAGVLSVSGSACLLNSAPPSWAPGQLESDTCIFGFYLGQNITPPDATTFNLTQTGTQDYGQPIIPGPEVTFAAGTVFDAFFVTFDPVGTTGGSTQEGTFVFDQKVVLLITSGDPAIYGGPEVGDWSTISADRNSLFLHFNAGVHVDQMVITTNAEPIPEPATALLAGAALLVTCPSDHGRGSRPPRRPKPLLAGHDEME